MDRPIYLILHPSHAGGWRWAVHLDDPDPRNIAKCINAGLVPDRDTADAVGQLVAYTALSVFGQLRFAAEIVAHELDRDPVIGIDTLNPLHS